MKRKWNWPLWIGCILALVGLVSFQFFLQFPATRDFPWVNLLLFAIAGVLLVVGLVHAFGRPQAYRGKIFGPILAVLSLLGFVFFSYGVFYIARQLPGSTGAPRVGQKAPEFSLRNQNGKLVALADLISGKGAILIFYRGFW